MGEGARYFFLRGILWCRGDVVNLKWETGAFLVYFERGGVCVMERLMQFVWQHRLGLRQDLRTVDGRRVRVVDQGVLNGDAGPDFFNASVEIGDETWVGNVEIHVRASDWFRHGHDGDRAYDSVVLHVVQFDDAEVKRSDGSVIPQVIMRCSAESAKRCNVLLEHAMRALPCETTVRGLERVFVTDWMTSLGVERMMRKSDRVLEVVEETGGHWEGAAYVTLARALGFGLNSEPFERLAKGLPLGFLNRHHDELMTVEALLFGFAGLIPEPRVGEDDYVTRLRQEYAFMAHKFGLVGKPLGWKMARTRPQNFPHRRIALLAQRIHEGFYLMGDLSDARSADEMRKCFEVTLAGFWATHYTFEESRGCTPRALSRGSIDSLLINVAVPLLHARARSRGDLDGMEQCVELLAGLPAECNSIVRLFVGAGVACDDAFMSQALIELRREYCEKKKCIYCRWGHRMLAAEIQR